MRGRSAPPPSVSSSGKTGFVSYERDRNARVKVTEIPLANFLCLERSDEVVLGTESSPEIRESPSRTDAERKEGKGERAAFLLSCGHWNGTSFAPIRYIGRSTGGSASSFAPRARAKVGQED